MTQNRKELLKTPLWSRHVALRARMGPFAGWEMPIRYPAGIIAEHRHTRTATSVFDTCHMGEIQVRGGDAASRLDALLGRPVLDQRPGTCRYNFLLNARGGVVDDLIVYRLEDEVFLLVVNAGTRDGDFARIAAGCRGGPCVLDESETTGKLDLQGPGSAAVLARLGVPPDSLPGYFRWCRGTIAGRPFLVSRTGYTGELGFEFYGAESDIRELWDALIGQRDVAAAGLGARDTLRLEMGYPLYGHELNEDTTPLEAGFAALVVTAGRVFVGRERLLDPPRRRLRGFVLDGRRAARAGDPIRTPAGELVGTVTSGAFSPSLARAIALGYVAVGRVEGVGEAVRFGEDWERGPGGHTAPLPLYRDGSLRDSVTPS